MISALERSTDSSSNGTQIPEFSLIESLRERGIIIELLGQTLKHRELEIDGLYNLLLRIKEKISQPDFNDQQRADIIQLIDDTIIDS